MPVDVQALVVRAGVNDTEPMLTPAVPRRQARARRRSSIDDAGTPRPPGVHLLWSVAGRARAAARSSTTRRRPATRPGASWSCRCCPTAGWCCGSRSPSERRRAARDGLGDRGGRRHRDAAGRLAGVQTSNDAGRRRRSPLAQLNVHVGGTSWTQCYDAALRALRVARPAGRPRPASSSRATPSATSSPAGGRPAPTIRSTAWAPTSGYRQRLARARLERPRPPEHRRVAPRCRRSALPGGDDVRARLRRSATPSHCGRAPGTGAALSQATGSGQVAPQARDPAPGHQRVPDGRGRRRAPATGADAHHAAARALHGVPLNSTPDTRQPPGQRNALRVVLGSATPDLAATIAASGTGLGQRRRRCPARRRAAAGRLLRRADHAHRRGRRLGRRRRVRARPRASARCRVARGHRPASSTSRARPPTRAPASGRARPASRPKPPKAIAGGDGPVERRRAPRDIGVHVDRRSRRVTRRPGSSTAARAPSRRRRPRRRPRGRRARRRAYHFPAPPVLAVAGGGRALSAVEREEADGALMCRLSDQVSQGHAGVLAASELLTSIGSGAVPDEVLELAREALAEDPYLARWRAQRAGAKGFDPDVAVTRFLAEAAVAHAYYAADNDRLSGYVGADGRVLGQAPAGHRGAAAAVDVRRRLGASGGRDHVGPAVAADVLRLGGRARPRPRSTRRPSRLVADRRRPRRPQRPGPSRCPTASRSPAAARSSPASRRRSPRASTAGSPRSASATSADTAWPTRRPRTHSGALRDTLAQVDLHVGRARRDPRAAARARLRPRPAAPRRRHARRTARGGPWSMRCPGCSPPGGSR